MKKLLFVVFVVVAFSSCKDECEKSSLATVCLQNNTSIEIAVFVNSEFVTQLQSTQERCYDVPSGPVSIFGNGTGNNIGIRFPERTEQLPDCTTLTHSFIR